MRGFEVNGDNGQPAKPAVKMPVPRNSPTVETARPLPERGAVDAATFAREISTSSQPVVLRGQVRHWPAVAAGLEGPRALGRYLLSFGGGKPLETLVGPPDIKGRFFYNPELSGFNFQRQHVPLPALVAELVRQSEGGADRLYSIYANAAAAADHLPGWVEANPLGLPLVGATPRLWIGNASTVAPHYDSSPNIAVVVAGQRRFTLFPPNQTSNLYVGPLDFTMAGPPSSMADPDAPDFQRYPRFAQAMASAQAAELEPGDAIVIPSLWWHHVRALSEVNVLANYWTDPTTLSPFGAMVHAMAAVRDLPAAERSAWRDQFQHYVFGDEAGQAGEHLPKHARGILGPASHERTEKIRGFLLGMLGRR